jgi:outer membrane protein OmpA-like peptidoglycan-associated protein
MLLRPRFRMSVGDVLLVLRWEYVAAEHGKIVAWDLVLRELARWLADPLDRMSLLKVYARVRGRGAPFEIDVVRRELAAALRSGRLLAVTKDKPRVYSAGPSVPQEKPEKPEIAPNPDLPTWFEVRLVDELGEPLPGIMVAFTLDDGVQKAPTDGDGVARVEGKGRSATVKPDDEVTLRQLLRDRWSVARGQEWYVPGGEASRHSIVQVRRLSTIPSTLVFAAARHTIVHQPRVVQADLKGLWFSTSKCFLLPPARHSLQGVTDLYAQNHECDVLIVGHTDRAGTPQYNDPLSLERAEAVAAYLKDDVDAWLAWYGSGKPGEKRWGADEDRAMIGALAEESGETIPEGEGEVKWFQRTRGLTVDGVAGPITRRALVTEYMGLDGTTLPEDITPVCHGCGENFPCKPTADGASEHENRRVELFLFDNPIAPDERPPAVLPPPPGTNSSPGAKEYPEWLLRVREQHEFVAGRWIRLLMRLVDGTPADNVPFKIRYSNGEEVVANTSDQGILMVHVSKEITWSILSVHDDSTVTAFV